MTKITIARFTPGTLYKLIFIGLLAIQILFTLIALVAILLYGGILWSQSFDGSIQSGESYWPLFAYLALGLVAIPFWAAIGWISAWPLMWAYSKYRPIKIGYIPYD